MVSNHSCRRLGCDSYADGEVYLTALSSDLQTGVHIAALHGWWVAASESCP
jgi:hypothetical protein